VEPLTGADPSVVREFRLLARLGAGGMGQVYLAASPAGRFIALKVIQPQFVSDPEFIGRFRAEADAAQRVSGLYTAPVVAAGVDDRPPWLATAFVPGPSLDEVVAAHGPLPSAAVWRLAAGLAEALRAIHAAGLVHRDLKPGNVLLASDGPRVIDFGISRAMATSSRLTAVGSTIGTPSYMSPEQVEARDIGPAGDVFSFGSVLAFAATGSSPFAVGPNGSAPSIMFRVVHEEPALDGVPGDLREVVAACLAKDPARRPDLGQVAARAGAAVEYLGLSPTTFWPADVAGVIDRQVTALSAELTALRGPGGSPPVTLTAAPQVPLPHPQTAGLGPQTAGPEPQRPMVPTPMASARPAPATSSRRGFLIGGSLVGAAAIVGGGAYAVSALAKTGGGKSGDNATSGPGSLAWRFAASQQPNAPTVAGKLVYFGTTGGAPAPFYAVHVADGKRDWFETPGIVSVPPMVTGGIKGGLLSVVDSTGTLDVRDAASGRELWNVPTRLQVGVGEKTWDADAAHIALAPGDGSVALYPATASGTRLWVKASSAAHWRYVALGSAGAVVYAYDDTDGTLFELGLGAGAVLWRFKVVSDGTRASTNLIVSAGSAYLGTRGGDLYCVDLINRKLRWSYSVPGAGFPVSDPVIAGDLVYFGDNNGVLYAIDAAQGTKAWSAHIGGGGPAQYAPAVANGSLYVATGNGLQQFSAATGQAGWSYDPSTASTPVQFVTSAAVTNGLVFAGGNDLRMYAIQT
jgi:outer membrane protein assembly factor BamB